jgi:hypothetical protein
MKKEIWKDIPGYVGLYQVSNWGNVKSLKRGKEHILKPVIHMKGYYRVRFNFKNYSIHQLVAMAFLNHKPDGTMKLVVNHIDGDKLNNYVDNLELVSNRYNLSCDKTDPGVYWRSARQKWQACIRIKDERIHLGTSKDKEKLIVIYQKAVNNIHLYDGDAKAFRLALSLITL